MKQLQALLIGQAYELTIAALPLLKRSNFEVDLIILNSKVIQSDLVRVTHYVSSANLLAELLARLSLNIEYDLVIVGDDATLLDILTSNLSEDLKTKFLPISTFDKSSHLYSKVALSKLFLDCKIVTPLYEIANNLAELLSNAKKIGYPLMVKLDQSGGGTGVFECNSESDVLAQQEKYLYPILVQKLVEGDTLDLSAFYQNGDLVHFTCSKFEKVIGSKYGPSSVRRYWQLACVEHSVFEELTILGHALGADGFVNVTAIESPADGKRYYFEADMRPNVWVDYGKYIGNDAAQAVIQFFTYGQALAHPQPFNPNFQESLLIPYYRRLKFFEVVMNRYHCWSYIARDRSIAMYLIAHAVNQCIALGCDKVKPYFPDIIWSKLSNIYRKSIETWVIKTISP